MSRADRYSSVTVILPAIPPGIVETNAVSLARFCCGAHSAEPAAGGGGWLERAPARKRCFNVRRLRSSNAVAATSPPLYRP